MKIPISLPSHNNIVIDVIKTNDNHYSATCGEVVNGYGMSSESNWKVYLEKDRDNLWDPVILFNVSLKDKVVPTFVRDTFEEALKDCMDYVYNLYDLKVR